jgi:hypothetical protein
MLVPLGAMNWKRRRGLLLFSVQVGVYAILVVLYLWFVLTFLTDWILQIEQKDILLYAVLSLLLIIGQGMILETVTATLLDFIQSRLKD